MALTIAGSTINPVLTGRHVREWRGTVTFDSSYPTGGEAASGISGKFLSLDALMLDSEDGYNFAYDSTNDKIIAYGLKKQPPLLVVEEALTVATNVGTLTYPPLYIVAIQVTAGTTTGAFNVIPTGETPLTKQCAVTFSSGVMTFLSTDAVTAASVTYMPQQPNGPFRYANLVVDEAITAAAAKTALANRAAWVQYVWDDTDGVLDGLEPVGEAPSATHKAVVDITNATPTTDIDFHADDEGNTVKVTYLKYAALPADCHLGDADVTLSTEVYEFMLTGGYAHLVVPGFGTQVVGEATATNVQVTWEGPSGTAAAGIATWNPKRNYIATDETTAITTLAMPWIVLDMNQIQPVTAAGSANASQAALDEVLNGTDLSGVVARFIAIGR